MKDSEHGSPRNRSERRRSPRVRCVRPDAASARFVGGAGALVRDLSRHGTALVGRQRASPGRTVVLAWDPGGVPVRLAARVLRSSVWSIDSGDGVEYLVVVEFLEAADDLWELATRAG